MICPTAGLLLEVIAVAINGELVFYVDGYLACFGSRDMSETIDHDTGKPIDQKIMTAGAGAIGLASLINQVAVHKETLEVVGKAALDLVKANPKVAAGVGVSVLVVGGACYCVKRITTPGSKFSIRGIFSYERAYKS